MSTVSHCFSLFLRSHRMLDSLGDSLNLLHLSLLNQRVLTLYLVSVQVYQSLNDHSQPQQLLLIWD